MEKGERELQTLGCFVHGILAGFHLLGMVYNYRRNNRRDTVLHALALAYDTHSAYKHYRAAEGEADVSH